jgi:hypothetical protein
MRTLAHDHALSIDDDSAHDRIRAGSSSSPFRERQSPRHVKFVDQSYQLPRFQPDTQLRVSAGSSKLEAGN